MKVLRVGTENLKRFIAATVESSKKGNVWVRC